MLELPTIPTGVVQRQPGAFVVVVGPSGVGKDSLLTYARVRLAQNPSVQFVRRVVTRESNATEDHDSVSVADFEAARLAGKFAVTWHAHGLQYGIPVDVRDFVENGGVAVCNGSRAALPEIHAAFPGALTVSIVADETVIRQRLAQRGRETTTAIESRLERKVVVAIDGQMREIDNSGDLMIGGEKLIDIILCQTAAGD